MKQYIIIGIIGMLLIGGIAGVVEANPPTIERRAPENIDSGGYLPGGISVPSYLYPKYANPNIAKTPKSSKLYGSSSGTFTVKYMTIPKDKMKPKTMIPWLRVYTDILQDDFYWFANWPEWRQDGTDIVIWWWYASMWVPVAWQHYDPSRGPQLIFWPYSPSPPRLKPQDVYIYFTFKSSARYGVLGFGKPGIYCIVYYGKYMDTEPFEGDFRGEPQWGRFETDPFYIGSAKKVDVKELFNFHSNPGAYTYLAIMMAFIVGIPIAYIRYSSKKKR